MGSTKAFLIGAGTAYLFDPQQGKRRRRMLLDRTAKVLRRTARFGTKKTRFAGGHLRGLLALFRLALFRRLGSHPSPRVDDATVTQRIRSSALRDIGISTRDVEVAVEDGVATLRGSVGSRTLAEDLIARVGRVPGVRDVADELHVSAVDSTT